ncbi:cold shock domain-containing protein [Vandammella animalimorsus]|uniref:cold shock domain-containing protein n=1 Tax=Vandammella animalimorsus TaxID=2029117 RepID=UPI00325C1E8C
MRFEGVVSRWNDDRGFGFLKASGNDDAEVFVHISEFPKDGRRPTVGERVSFEVVTDEKGKKKAKNLFCPDRPKAGYARAEKRLHARRGYSKARESASWLGLVFRVALLVIGVAVAYLHLQNEWQERRRRQELSQMLSSTPVTPVQATSSVYRCDGRTHCSQMTSCEEAKFFINNCPGTKMDSDNDGVPCESQWCSGGW